MNQRTGEWERIVSWQECSLCSSLSFSIHHHSLSSSSTMTDVTPANEYFLFFHIERRIVRVKSVTRVSVHECFITKKCLLRSFLFKRGRKAKCLYLESRWSHKSHFTNLIFYSKDYFDGSVSVSHSVKRGRERENREVCGCKLMIILTLFRRVLMTLFPSYSPWPLVFSLRVTQRRDRENDLFRGFVNELCTWRTGNLFQTPTRAPISNSLPNFSLLFDWTFLTSCLPLPFHFKDSAWTQFIN